MFNPDCDSVIMHLIKTSTSVEDSSASGGYRYWFLFMLNILY